VARIAVCDRAGEIGDPFTPAGLGALPGVVELRQRCVAVAIEDEVEIVMIAGLELQRQLQRLAHLAVLARLVQRPKSARRSSTPFTRAVPCTARTRRKMTARSGLAGRASASRHSTIAPSSQIQRLRQINPGCS
jgi:hypothetical protein